MRTNVTVADAPYGTVLAMADPVMDRADIFREALTVFVRVQADIRLAALGGTMPDMEGPLNKAWDCGGGFCLRCSESGHCRWPGR